VLKVYDYTTGKLSKPYTFLLSENTLVDTRKAGTKPSYES
jgi:hypothetical protein